MKKHKYDWLGYVAVFLLGFITATTLFFAPYLKEGTEVPAAEEFQPIHKTIPILGVSVQNKRGIVGYANIDIRPGESRVLVDTNPFLEPDIQYSANTAVKVAENVTKIPVKNKEIIFSFDIESVVLGGPSAGAAMTLLTIAALTDRQIKDDVMITGTIMPNGGIGTIGNIIEKSDAAGMNKTKVLLVPPSQRTLTYYDRRFAEQKVGNETGKKFYYVPRYLDINQYTRDTYNMSVKEVTDIGDVMRYMLVSD